MLAQPANMFNLGAQFYDYVIEAGLLRHTPHYPVWFDVIVGDLPLGLLPIMPYGPSEDTDH